MQQRERAFFNDIATGLDEAERDRLLVSLSQADFGVCRNVWQPRQWKPYFHTRKSRFWKCPLP